MILLTNKTMSFIQNYKYNITSYFLSFVLIKKLTHTLICISGIISLRGNHLCHGTIRIYMHMQIT